MSNRAFVLLLAIPLVACDGDGEVTTYALETGTESSDGDSTTTPGTTTSGGSAAGSSTSDGDGGSSTAAPGCEPERCGQALKCGIVEDGCEDVAHCGVCATAALDAPLVGSDIVADATRDVFYVSVPESALHHAGSLVVADPAADSVDTLSLVGADPGALALSPDGATLWVSLRGDGAVRDVDVSGAGPIPGATHDVPATAGGDPAFALDMAVLADGGLAIATAAVGDGSPSGVVILDGGVPRASRSTSGVRSLCAGGDGRLYGVGEEAGQALFFVLDVDASGVTQASHSDLASAPSVEVDCGFRRVFLSSGEVVDVSDAMTPSVAGAFAAPGSVVLRANRRGAILSSSAPPSIHWVKTDAIEVIGMRELHPTIDTQTLDSLASVPSGESYAFRAADGVVHVVDGFGM